MAAKSKLELILELKNKLFNKKLMETQKKFTGASSKMMGKINQLKSTHIKAFSAMRDQFPLMGRGMDLITNKYVLQAAAIAGFALLLGSATQKAISFNHEFLQIEQLNLDKNKKDMEQYKDIIRDTAFTVGTDLNKTTAAFYDVQSATGLFGNEAKKVVQEVGKFSIATGADLNDSINSTTKAMKAFGLGANDIKGYLESNAKTVQVGITTFEELARVQTEYAGAAAGAGQTVNTANKIFAAFTSIAKDSNTAANMTKTAFQGLTQAGTIKGLKSIGISMYDSNGQMRDLSQVLGEVSGKFKTMSPKKIDELINKIGGPEGLRNLFVKLKTGSEDFFNTLTAFDSSKFDLDKALKNAQGDVTVLGNIVKNRWGVVMENLGQKILPLVAGALNTVNNLLVKGFKFYKDNSEIINLVVGSILGVIAAIKTWTIVQGILNAVLTANPIGLIIAAIGALVAAITWVVRNVQGWGDQWTSILDYMRYKVEFLKFGLQAAWGLVSDSFQRMVEGIVLAWKWGMNLVGKISDAQYAKDKANILRQQKERERSIKLNALAAAASHLKANKALEFKLKLKKDQEDTQDENSFQTSTGLTPDAGGANGGSSSKAADEVSKVVGAGQQVRNITVNIDALNKGGINTSNTTLSKMEPQDIEKWMTESLLRVVRNLELSI